MVLEKLPVGARVLVIRLRSLGDCVLTTPALEILKDYRSDLRVGIVVEERFAEVFAGNPNLDDILPPKRGAVARWGTSLVINLHGGTRSMELAALSLARWRAGFAHFRGAWLYNVKIPRAQQILGVERKVHTAEHLASAMFHLGVTPRDIPPARLYAGSRLGQTPYAVFHPFASLPEKTWPAERFLEVAAALHKHHGLAAVFIGSAADDWRPFAGHQCVRGAPLADVKALLAGASLFLGNDSGPAHMAAAFGAPVVVLFSASDPAVWSPWKTRAEVLLDPESIRHIGAAQVLQASAELLRQHQKVRG